MTIYKGDVSVEHTVWCAKARNLGGDDLPFKAGSTVGHPFGCESHHQTSGTAAVARAEARAKEWRDTKEFGWLCPPCYAAYKRWRKGTRRERASLAT